MADVNDLDRALKQIREENLSTLGITDGFFQEILAYRLLIERLGEEDNNHWWESLALTRFGRDSLEEVAPRTAVKARLDLTQRVGRKAERERLPENTISLFYLGSAFENRLENSLSDLTNSTNFEPLENLNMELTTTGWTEELGVEGDIVESSSDSTIAVGTIPETELDSREVIRSAARELFAAYGASTTNELRVPYFSIEQ